MPVVNGRKRRQVWAQPQDDPESSDAEPSGRSTQRRRHESSPEPDDGDTFVGDEGGQSSGVQPLARKLVRYALACEYSRQPIRRSDLNEKILPKDGRKGFKPVFTAAQDMLRDVFGMEMVELPVKDKVTVREKRAAQKADKPATGSSSWVLQSTLPSKYRRADIIPPPKIPTTETESAYVALYSFIIATIYFNGGSLAENKLERYLRRTNADQHTPVGKKDDLLKRLIKEQYIVKIRDTMSGEEVVEYMVGPRGKVEVGEEGAAEFARAVFGNSVDDLEKRLDRSLGLEATRQVAKNSAADTTSASAPNGAGLTQRRKSRRGHSGIEDEDSDDYESE